MSTSANKLSAEEHARLDSYMLIIAGEARGHHKHDGSGKHTFGSKGAHCVYADGQYHDFSSSGPTAHGHGALAQIRHLYSDVDSVEWARAFLATHPGAGDFVPGADTNTKGSAEEDAERVAYLNALYEGAAFLTEDTLGYRFFVEGRRLSLPPEALALLRWVPNFRGDEGVILVPYTGHAGELLALGFTYITQDAQKSSYPPARMIYRGPIDWNSRALVRLGAPGPVAVEVESFEKGLAAFLVGYQCVFVTGGVHRFGLVLLPPEVQKVIIGRDDDPPGSDPDQAMWRGAMRRRAQNLQVGVTLRPKALTKVDGAPWPDNFKDCDDVYRLSPDLLRVLLDDAGLDPKKHGRLGEVVDNAIIDELSRFDEVDFGRAGRDAATVLGLGSVERLSARISKLVKARIKAAGGDEGPDGLPGKAVTFAPLVLHPTHVNCAELLSEMAAAFLKYVRLSPAEGDMAALGAMHSHCFDFFDVLVIFVVSSPKPRSGKTRLLRLVARIVPKKLFISGSGAATAFIIRVIEMYGPNVFLDEFDNIMKGNPEAAEAFRGVLNSAFDRESAVTGKCVPTEQGYMPRTFSLWAPYWIGGLKKPPETVEDRAIIFKLRRKLPGDKVRPLRLRDAKEFDVFRSKAARWATDNEQALRAAEPSCPDKLLEFSDRAADACGPLFAIAQLAEEQSPGSGWLARAHHAALTMMGIQTEERAPEKGVAGEEIAAEGVADKDDEIALFIDICTILIAIDMHAPEPEQLRDKQIAITALEDVRRLADADTRSDKPPKVTPVISGVQLATALERTHLFPDRKWSGWDRGKPIQSHHLVKILRDYEITQRTVRLPGVDKTMWGFTRIDLDDVLVRYVYPAEGTLSCGYNLRTHSHIVENVEETAPHTFSRESSKTPPKNEENNSNYMNVGDARAAKTDNSHAESRARHTHPNFPSDDPKPPQSNVVGLPIGAVPRRRREGEP
jgi:Protein of unknown function (DUF3631)